MSRNVVWLWQCYDAQGKDLGTLEGTNKEHALEEASYELPDTVKVVRVKGSGRPNEKITPDPKSPVAQRAIDKVGQAITKMLSTLAYPKGKVDTQHYNEVEGAVVDRAEELGRAINEYFRQPFMIKDEQVKR